MTSEQNATGQTRMYLQTDGSVASAWVEPDQIDALRAMGYRFTDPARIPEDFDGILDEEPRGLIPIQSNFGGELKFVRPYEVAWYETNGWTAVHRVGQAGQGFVPPPVPARRVAPPATGSNRVIPQSDLR